MVDIAQYDWTPEQAKQDQAQFDQMTSRVRSTLKLGDNVLRILPRRNASPFIVVPVHYIDTPDNKTMSVVCPFALKQQECPVHGRINRLFMTGNPADNRVAFRMQHKRRAFVNVIDNSAGLPPEQLTPVVREIPETVYEGLIALRTKPTGGNYAHPVEGFDVVITRTGSGRDTKYTDPAPSMQGRYPLPRMEWLEMTHDLEQYAALPDPEKMREVCQIIDARTGGGGGGRQPMINVTPGGGYNPPGHNLPPARPAIPTMASEMDADDLDY